MRAKFYVTDVKQTVHTTLPPTVEEDVTLYAVYSNNNVEDNQFSAATPSGQLTMHISNPNAIGFLKEGKKYYLDFTEAAE